MVALVRAKQVPLADGIIEGPAKRDPPRGIGARRHREAMVRKPVTDRRCSRERRMPEGAC
jgi:hypothetical protein